MSGFSEILIIIAVILAIIVLPKRLSNKSETVVKKKRRIRLSGWTRMAVLISLLWLAFFTFYYKPWDNRWLIFIYTGISPVVVYWGIFWIFLGFKKKS